MPDLREQLRKIFDGRVCVVGVGNVDQGDDAFGVRLAEALACEVRDSFEDDESRLSKAVRVRTALQNAARKTLLQAQPALECGACPHRFDSVSVLVTGITPERNLSKLTSGGFDHVLFLDAVQFDAPPGSVVLLHSSEMAARFPQVSTHRISLGLLARWIEENSAARVWLLGVQPDSLRPGHSLSPAVETACELLTALIAELASRRAVGQHSDAETWTDDTHAASECRAVMEALA